MRLPLVAELDSRDGTADRDSRLTNALVEPEEGGQVTQVRPGLVTTATTVGNGNGIVCFSGELVSIFGATLGAGIVEDGVFTETLLPGGLFQSPYTSLPVLRQTTAELNGVLYGVGIGPRTLGVEGINAVVDLGETLQQEYPVLAGVYTMEHPFFVGATLYAISTNERAWAQWTGSAWGTPVVTSGLYAGVKNPVVNSGTLYHGYAGGVYTYDAGADLDLFQAVFTVVAFNFSTGTFIGNSVAYYDPTPVEEPSSIRGFFGGEGTALYGLVYNTVSGEVVVYSFTGVSANTVLFSATLPAGFWATLENAVLRVSEGKGYFILQNLPQGSIFRVYVVDFAAQTINLFQLIDTYVAVSNPTVVAADIVVSTDFVYVVIASTNSSATPIDIGDTAVYAFPLFSGKIVPSIAPVSNAVYDFTQSPL